MTSSAAQVFLNVRPLYAGLLMAVTNTSFYPCDTLNATIETVATKQATDINTSQVVLFSATPLRSWEVLLPVMKNASGVYRGLSRLVNHLRGKIVAVVAAAASSSLR